MRQAQVRQAQVGPAQVWQAQVGPAQVGSAQAGSAQQASHCEVAHQGAGAERPGFALVGGAHAVHQAAELRRGDGDDVAGFVGEALARARRGRRSGANMVPRNSTAPSG